jgi:uncharacterized protein
MKFQADSTQGPSITGYGEGWVSVNGEKFTGNLVVNSANRPEAWTAKSFEDLKPSDFEIFASMDVELVLFGSGDRIRFPHPEWLGALYAKRIGLETMDTPAACRTFNFLAGEGRKVVAALLL